MSRLEIGPRDTPLDGEWLTLDAREGFDSDFVCEWGKDPIPVEDDSLSLVYASHVLEHVPWERTHHALVDVFRILQPGGAFEVWVPDLQVIVNAMQSGKIPDGWRRSNPEGDVMKWVNGRLFAYGPGHNWHKAAFTKAYLRRCLERAGFVNVTPLAHPRGYDHGPINMGMKGVKP